MSPKFLSILAVLGAFLTPLPGHAQPGASGQPAQIYETLVLVARPAWKDPVYGRSILIAHAMPGGEHVGFILNNPTGVQLSDAFPGHIASKAVTDPIYLGGPSDLNVVFALVHGAALPDEGAVALTQDLYLAISSTAVDKAITPATEKHARFFIGAVVWRPGELDAEIKQGAWYVLDATPQLVLPERTAGLWEELVRQAEVTANAI